MLRIVIALSLALIAGIASADTECERQCKKAHPQLTPQTFLYYDYKYSDDPLDDCLEGCDLQGVIRGLRKAYGTMEQD